MERGSIKINNPERFRKKCTIAPDKIRNAINKALTKLNAKSESYTNGFPRALNKEKPYTQYELTENDNWECGMLTGCYIAAYEISGDKRFLEVAEKHMATYRKRVDERIELDDHDVGFSFTPSCTALYKATGNTEAKEIALDAAEYFYNTSYTPKGKFILREFTADIQGLDGGCRTMMDTMMNAPLLYWAAEETGKNKYAVAAKNQAITTDECLIRDDGSSYHHYQFELKTYKPLYGLTFQGHADESCWSRGHAWGIYGFPIAYKYTKDERFVKVWKDMVAFMLNHMPDDNMPYYDYDFVSGDEPRDASAAVVSACGLLEMAKLLPDDPDREIYENAAYMMIESTIDKFTSDKTKDGEEYDGLLWGVTLGHLKSGIIGGETCAVYGDYFYMEALLRCVRPEWEMWW